MVRLKKLDEVKIKKLTEREVHYLQLATNDLSDMQIAEIMDISYYTVVRHRTNVQRKLKTFTKLGSVVVGLKLKITT